MTNQTSKLETAKFEVMLDVISARNIRWVSDETEELLSQKIRDTSVTPEDIEVFVKSWNKLHVAEVEWMKFKGMDVYFAMEAY